MFCIRLHAYVCCCKVLQSTVKKIKNKQLINAGNYFKVLWKFSVYVLENRDNNLLVKTVCTIKGSQLKLLSPSLMINFIILNFNRSFINICFETSFLKRNVFLNSFNNFWQVNDFPRDNYTFLYQNNKISPQAGLFL